MDTIKDRNSEDLTEAEEIKKRWQEKSYMKKILMTRIATMLLSLTFTGHFCEEFHRACTEHIGLGIFINHLRIQVLTKFLYP